MAREKNDENVTDRRLRLLVGLVVVAALLAGALAVAYALIRPTPVPGAGVLVLLCLAVVLANRLLVRVRIRSNGDGTTWGELPILIGLCILPPPWVIACVFVGSVILRILDRRALQKTMFAIARDVLVTTAGAAVFVAAGVRPDLAHPPFALGAMIAAFLALVVVDNAAYIPIITTASGMSVRRFITHNLDVKIATIFARIIATALIMGVLALNVSRIFLIIFPLIVGFIHLWQTRQIRTREERDSWRRLAAATDELNSVDLTQVLHAAVSQAALIFSATEAEIDIAEGEARRIVRGTGQGVAFDGPAPSSAEREDEIRAALITHDGQVQVGMLRLRFGGRIRLTEFEHYKLKIFASALCTALRNAVAYAELARLNEQNLFAATHDPLTGLANRRALYDRAAEQFHDRTDEGVAALLLIDLNHFKEVNDTLGHAAGDAVLRHVARRLSGAAAEGDVVARLGGDEFAVLLTNLATPALATHRAAALLGALDEAVEVEGMPIVVEAAAGIALAAGSGGINELMRRADVAMYQAKRGGQQVTTYTHAQDPADVSRLLLGGELQRAVTEHEFVVDFQPIVDLGSGEVISAEALARWHHPEHGHLTPIQFLETVERSGRLPDFAGMVLDQALAAAGSWREAGFDLPVSVNVSPRSLLDPRFPEDVLSRLEQHAMPTDRLVLELTETLTISQIDVVGRALAELREAGVKLALDDFGTGVSSLSVLSHIPVHQIKIDREFVTSLETSSEAAAVIRSTVDLARSLHLTVIAEGVESEPQRRVLWELGCVAGQGHLFARAMPSARLLGTLQRGSGGQPGVLAAALHDGGSVVRLPRRRTHRPPYQQSRP